MSESETHIVSVYGTLKKGHGNHILLEGSEFIGQGITKEKYHMASSGIPYLIDTRDRDYQAIIETYRVDNRTLKRLDALEGHPHFYERKSTVVIVDGQEIESFIYILNGDTKCSPAPLVNPSHAKEPEDHELFWCY